jgi:steroid delta-isomerase-like uncharacterized protein
VVIQDARRAESWSFATRKDVTSMSASENMAMVRRLFEQGMNERKPEVFDDCVAADFVNHDLPGSEPGPRGFFESFRVFEAAFPDLHVHLGEVLAADDRVITRSYWTGTHKGEFMGVPASGASVQVDFIDIWRVDNGRLAECWVRMDLLALMQQIGAVPA